MQQTLTLPTPNYTLERVTLDNGLRVLLAPDRNVPIVGVAVYYDVGIRSEPAGRTGFAHLFEHLMFQGSANLDKLEHARFVQSAGGSFNGSTHLDYTNYHEVLPSNALERALFLEADRMRSPRITEENLANQIAVVKEEIRVNVMNRPYGAFPWLQLPPVIFETFPNAHNGYGDFIDLESATIDDAARFFEQYYAPANALLCVAGDFEVPAAIAAIERYFGDIPARPVPARPDFDEPDLTSERRDVTVDAHAPMPAIAAAWRVPDPTKDLTAYLPYLMLTEVLAASDAARLRQRLIHQDQTATHLACYLGFMGDPLDVRNPTALLFQAHHPAEISPDTLLSTVDEELARLANDGLADGELRRVVARLGAQVLGEFDSVLGRALNLSAFELIHNRAELVNELPALLAAVTEEQVRQAAATLQPNRRAALELVAKGAS